MGNRWFFNPVLTESCARSGHCRIIVLAWIGCLDHSTSGTDQCSWHCSGLSMLWQLRGLLQFSTRPSRWLVWGGTVQKVSGPQEQPGRWMPAKTQILSGRWAAGRTMSASSFTTYIQDPGWGSQMPLLLRTMDIRTLHVAIKFKTLSLSHTLIRTEWHVDWAEWWSGSVALTQMCLFVLVENLRGRKISGLPIPSEFDIYVPCLFVF